MRAIAFHYIHKVKANWWQDWPSRCLSLSSILGEDREFIRLSLSLDRDNGKYFETIVFLNVNCIYIVLDKQIITEV